MLHIHFGAGRLGLGLVAPFLQTGNSELYLLNRASSGNNPTGTTALNPARRNKLLQTKNEYVIETPGAEIGPRERVRYDSFIAYREEDIETAIRLILDKSKRKGEGVLVTASVLTLGHYAPVLDALNVICIAKEAGAAIGDVYLVACENTVSAHEVLTDSKMTNRLHEAASRHVRGVHASVDRVCVEMEEGAVEGQPTVVVRAEEYGSLKFELGPDTEHLSRLLEGSKVEFSKHLAVEKEIKSWLLNGSHWLIALTAFHEAGGNSGLKLNQFILGSEENHRFASDIIAEMRDGIEALLRSETRYAAFVRDVDVSAYLNGAASVILKRFEKNEDTIARILARFRTPTEEDVESVQKFVDRFLGRVEPPLMAYQATKGLPAKAATHSLFNLFRLQASGIYVDTVPSRETSDEGKAA